MICNIVINTTGGGSDRKVLVYRHNKPEDFAQSEQGW